MADEMPIVKDLSREYEAFLPIDLSYQHFDRETETLPGRYASPSGRLLAAHCNGQIIGCVALRKIGEGICEMKRLYVKPAFQGRGIGQALCEAIIEEARQIGYKRMRPDTLLQPAKRLCASLGFVEIPPYEDVPIESVVFMERVL